MTGNVVFCPFCGYKLLCPVPVPERAACPACGALFELRYLMETAVLPRLTQQAAAPPQTVPADRPPAREAPPQVDVPTEIRHTGLALIVAGVLGVLFSGASAILLALPVAGTLNPLHPPQIEDVPATAVLVLSLVNTVSGVLIAAAGVYTLVKPRSLWTWVGIALTFLPTSCCCVFLAPVGLFALVNLTQFAGRTS